MMREAPPMLCQINLMFSDGSGELPLGPAGAVGTGVHYESWSVETHTFRTGGNPMAKAKEKKLQELFHETLKDIYFAEKKILTALPKMAKAARSDELRAAFKKHEGQTEHHVRRLEQVFEEIDAKPQGKTCDAVMGIIAEGQDVMKEYKGAPALDAGLLAAAQAVEHYEISRYGTLITWADELGFANSSKLMKQTLGEEKETDKALSELAVRAVNQEAEQAAE
jgi:ferritin-like metal-binding protein YciE